MNRPRTILAALAALALSAGAVLGATPPPAAEDGLSTAGEASGMTVPPTTPPDLEVPAPTPTEENGEEGDENTPDPTPDENGEHPDNHGAVVSQAAQGETPEGWANHGAYVSAVARGLVEPGDPAPEEAVANGGRLKPQKPAHPTGGKPEGVGKP